MNEPKIVAVCRLAPEGGNYLEIRPSCMIGWVA